MEENTGRLYFVITAVIIVSIALGIMIKAGLFHNFGAMIYSVISHARLSL